MHEISTWCQSPRRTRTSEIAAQSHAAGKATFQRPDGLSLDDRQQFGILVASAAVIASNTYVLMNTYRWDWLTVLINAISSLLLYFWTGVYTSTTASAQFYNHGAEVYGSLAYWTVLFVTVVLCLRGREKPGRSGSLVVVLSRMLLMVRVCRAPP